MSVGIKKYEFKAGFKHEIEVINLKDVYQFHSSTIDQPHRTDFYHIFWFQKGAAAHTVDFKELKELSNSLLFVNKEQVQMFDRLKASSGKVLIFTDRFFGKTQDDINYLHRSILFNDLLDTARIKLSANTKYLAELFGQIEAELAKEDDTFSYDILQNMLHNFLLFSERERRKTGYKEIKKGADLDHTTLFRDLLDVQYKKVRSVFGFAAQLNISEKRLTQATSKTLGRTPKQLIDERILLEAKRLLIHTSDSIKQIGYEIGFDEPTNFIKYFKKHTGKTPIEFRERY